MPHLRGSQFFLRMKGLPAIATLSVFVFYFLTRLWPILQFGDRAFGYDTGIYRHYILGYFERLGDPTLTPFAFSALSNVLTLLGTSVDGIMFGWYIAIACMLFLAVYAVVKTYFDSKIAIISIFLFATSVVQFEFYSWYYYRNFIALLFVLVAFLLIHKKSYLVIFPLIGIGLLHPISFIPIGIAFFLYGCVESSIRHFSFLSLGSAGILILVINWPELYGYLSTILGQGALVKDLNPIAANEFTGQFIDTDFFWRAALLYLPASLVGVITWWRKQKLFLIFLAINILIGISGVIFYRRVFVFIDISLLFFAAAGLVWYYKKIQAFWLGKAVAIAFVLLILVQSFVHIKHKEPIISNEEFLAIQSLNELPPNSYVMTLSSYTAPWLYGYTSQRIIAPGLFEYNKWNYDQWMQFWTAENGKASQEMLLDYPRPLYIFVGSSEFVPPFLQDSTYFTYISPSVWQVSL